MGCGSRRGWKRSKVETAAGGDLYTGDVVSFGEKRLWEVPIVLGRLPAPLAAMRSAPVTNGPNFSRFQNVADHVGGDERSGMLPPLELQGGILRRAPWR